MEKSVATVSRVAASDGGLLNYLQDNSLTDGHLSTRRRT